MKKIFLGLVTMLIVFLAIPLVASAEKVPVYMISKEGCPACQSATEYFDGLQKEHSDLFQLFDIQVFDSNWNFVSNDHQDLFLSLYEKLGEDTSKAATPTIIIGDFHSVGLPQDTSVIYDKIVETKDAKNKVDIVKEVAKELNIDLEKITNNNTDTNEKKSGKYDALIIVAIFIVLIGGFAGLVLVSKKS